MKSDVIHKRSRHWRDARRGSSGSAGHCSGHSPETPPASRFPDGNADGGVSPTLGWHPTLSSWLKNINKLEGLVNRLQDLASSALTDHRSQLLKIMPINVCSTLTPRFGNRASFWIIWKSTWKPPRSYMEMSLILKLLYESGTVAIFVR